MYCPQCGQQQVSSEMRFCSRCGLPLGGVTELLAQGGVLKSGGEELRESALSPRRRGARRGISMILLGTIIVPILAILNSYQIDSTTLDILVPVCAVLFFAGGLMRILYAAMFESATPDGQLNAPAAASPLAAPAHLGAGVRASALPPAQGIPVPDFTPRRMNTAELRQPPSVTENTTRLLEEDKAARNGFDE